VGVGRVWRVEKVYIFAALMFSRVFWMNILDLNFL
jgi:hypothetical protein